MSRLPLRLRLTLVFALVMAIVLSVVGTVVYVRLASSLNEQVDERLALRADALRARGAARGPLPGAEEDFGEILGSDGGVRAATPVLAGGPLLSGAELRRARRGQIVVERDLALPEGPERVRLLARPLDGAAVAIAGTSLGERDEALDGLLAAFLVGGPLALLLACGAGFGLAGAALRPVEAMRRRAAAISAATASSRLPVPDADDEVARLARTLNEMLGRLEAALERERRFVAEASHELRTPLALLKTELELALRRPRSAEELQAALASAAEDTDRLVRLANDLLLLASADEGGLRVATERIAVRDLLKTVAGRFSASAHGRPVVVAATDDLTLDADRVRLEQALGNLVDNALRHGRGAVRLEAQPRDGGVVLRVRDEGEGFPAAFLPQAFERFSRPDESRSAPGAGLGLALVRAIVEAHGGSASVEPGDGAGASVILVLPGMR